MYAALQASITNRPNATTAAQFKTVCRRQRHLTAPGPKYVHRRLRESATLWYYYEGFDIESLLNTGSMQQLTQMRSLRARRYWLVAAMVLFSAAVTQLSARRLEGRGQEEKKPVAEAVVQRARCSQCHAEESAGYSRTGMARSFYKPGAEDMDPGRLKSSTFHHAASSTTFAMMLKDGLLWQRRWQTGPGGEAVNVEELQVDEVMGSGNHARTYLHREPDGRLIELPLAWYSEAGGYYALNPGFDNAHPATRRAISYECMACHNGYPQTPDLAHVDYEARPVYLGTLPEGINCERCHGPGEKHMAAAEDARTSLATVRAAIVNPARLDPAAQMQSCEQCHLQTTSQPLPDHIRHFEKAPFSYRVGDSLSESVSHFVREPSISPMKNFEIVSAPLRLRQSRCFGESNGALTCLTCHNPHNLEKGPAARTYYTKICLNCHGATLPAKVAGHQNPASADCVSCHMPVRRTEDVVHVLMTDHLIQRRPPPARELQKQLREIEPTTETAYRGPVRPYEPHGSTEKPSSSYTALAQVVDSSNLKSGIPALRDELRLERPSSPQFDIILGDAQHRTGDLAGAVASYREALLLDPQSERALRSLGVTLADQGESAQAIATLDQATALFPTSAVLFYEKGRAKVRTGAQDQGIIDLQRALDLEPDLAPARNELGLAYAQTGRLVDAEREFRDSLSVDPYDAGAEANLANALAGREEWTQAAFYFSQAVRLAPAVFSYRMAYLTALARGKDRKQLQDQAHAAADASPVCSTLLPLGELLGAEGFGDLAEEDFGRCLSKSPRDSHANYDLGLIHLQRHDRTGAIERLRVAAEGDDVQIADRARALLRRIEAP